MMVKGVAAMLAEANGEIESVSADEAKSLSDADDVLFVDVRESGEHEQECIPGSVHAPRGFLEFLVDPASAMHRPELAAGKRLIVYCASGGRSVLAAKTLVDMGLGNVRNLSGGIAAWKAAGGPVQ